MKQDSIQLNSDIVDFSYDALTPGDVIVYYKNGETEASHVSLFLGKFKNAAAVKKYLIRMGVSKQLAEACVKDWGAYYDNDGTYWCIPVEWEAVVRSISVTVLIVFRHPAIHIRMEERS